MRTFFNHLFLFCCLLSPAVINAQFSVIRHELNTIVLPNDSSSWFELARKIETVRLNGNLKILHFGDSHIQGDYFTGQVRKHLFNYADAKTKSRGITMPYLAAGTNGPDELFSRWQGCIERNSVRKGPTGYYALTGYRITSCDTFLAVTLRDTSDYKFNLVYLLHNHLNTKSITINGYHPVLTHTISDSSAISEFRLPEFNHELTIRIRNSVSTYKPSIYALLLQNTQNNIAYHSAGINGATFGTFQQLQDTRTLIQFIAPDCVILSYGTNDAMNRINDTTSFKAQIADCIQTIRQALPGVPVILTTPGDYLINKQRINPGTALVARLICSAASENNCAYWDFYQVMGGAGSVKEWYKNQLVFRDWIHLSKKGYRYQGDLFFEAFLKIKNI